MSRFIVMASNGLLDQMQEVVGIYAKDREEATRKVDAMLLAHLLPFFNWYDVDPVDFKGLRLHHVFVPNPSLFS